MDTMRIVRLAIVVAATGFAVPAMAAATSPDICAGAANFTPVPPVKACFRPAVSSSGGRVTLNCRQTTTIAVLQQ
jgi:hypothetical protein